jgi:tripartite-type tricarboxylate transporter receptor subunit TctC
MTTRRVLLRRATLAFLAPSIVHARATWPNKPITIGVNATAGGQTDTIALTGRRQCLA